MLRLTKSYRLLRFLNSRPPGPARVLIAGGAGGVALCLSASLRLGRMIARRIWAGADMKAGFRQLAWIAGRRGLTVLPDPFFDVTEGTTEVERAALIRLNRSSRAPDVQKRLDHLSLVVADARYPMPRVTWDELIEEVAAETHAILTEAAARPLLRRQADTRPRQADFPTIAARAALQGFARCVPASDLPWFVISGTFLGLIREGRFLPHDYDIDLGVMAQHVRLDDLLGRIEGSGVFRILEVAHQHSLAEDRAGTILSRSKPAILKVRHRDGVHVDIFWHYRDGEVLWHGSAVHRWVNTAFSLSPYQLEGCPVLGPSDPDIYLTENYGDWRTPRLSFNATSGTPNLQMAQNLQSLVLFLRRYVEATTAGPAAAAAAMRPLISEGYLVDTGSGYHLHAERFLEGPRVDPGVTQEAAE